jgi:hypothetical protein
MDTKTDLKTEYRDLQNTGVRLRRATQALHRAPSSVRQFELTRAQEAYCNQLARIERMHEIGEQG